MNNLFCFIKSFMLDGSAVVSPLYDAISLIGPIAITVVLMLSIIWGIFLGTKYAKCDDASERANLHQVLINFIIGAVTVWILLCVLYAIRGPLVNLINS